MSEHRVLCVDDDREMLDVVVKHLSLLECQVASVSSGLKALERIREERFDLVFTDLLMPEIGGLELLSAVKETRPDTEVIILTGYADVDSAIEAMKLGAYDYLQKPLNFDRLKLLAVRVFEKKALQRENRRLRSRLEDPSGYGELVGVSPVMRRIYDRIERMREKSPTVLIQGESGTGKEVAARTIHRNSARSDGPFVPVNCGAMVDGLLESELFGHVKGAFTGAVREHDGLFRAAAGGTLFLDEISEISPPLQVKLLRVLQERRIRPVGGTRELPVDVRVVAATNRTPETLLTQGILRKDLFYRLNVVSVRMPPLRERREDISPLVRHFANRYAGGAKDFGEVSSEAMRLLLAYHWPGNVRELENAVERALALSRSSVIRPEDLPARIRERGEAGDGESSRGQVLTLRESEIRMIRRALRHTGGNKARAAKLLGINITTLYRKIKSFGLADEVLQNAN
ncbi:MAG: sigma-54-dependent transcriptional regulator [Thermodesulfobacteriota bacterium]